MHLIIQENLWHEEQYDYFINILKSLDIKHTIVKVVPFSHELIPEPIIEKDEQVMVFGGTTFIKIAKQRNYNYGAYYLHSTYQQWIDMYGANNMLNNFPIFSDFSSVPYELFENMDYFIRPIEDTKCFSGQVINNDAHKNWVKSLQSVWEKGEYCAIHPNTKVMVHALRKTLQEYRFFILDQTIVAQSVYKIGKNAYSERGFMKTMPIEQGAIIFVINMLKLANPCTGYVLDVAKVGDDEYKIVELNCFNSSGFYGCNMQSVVKKLQEKFLRDREYFLNPAF